MKTGKHLLSSERLFLKSISENDIEAIYSYRSLPEVAKFQYWEPFSKERTHTFVQQCALTNIDTRGEWIGLAIMLKEKNTCIGDCAMKIENEEAEIGCNISPGKSIADCPLLPSLNCPLKKLYKYNRLGLPNI